MLSLDHGLEVNPVRPAEEDFGETGTGTPLSAIKVAYLLDDPAPIVTDSGTSYTQQGKLYAPRGSGLQHGDVIPLPEGKFTIVGNAQLDHVHPMNGHDFGVARFFIRLGG